MPHFCPMKTEDAIKAMKNFMEGYVPFSEGEWDQIQPLHEVKSLEKNELLLKQGEICTTLAFVVSGALRQFRTEDVDPYAYDFSFQGDYAVDFASFVSQRPCTIGISALRTSVLVCISKKNLDAAYQVSPAFQEFGRLMVERALVYDDSRGKSLLYDSPEERYLNLMERDPELLQEIPLYSIASYLGIRPESLSRVRANLNKKK